MLDFFKFRDFKTSPSSAIRWVNCLASPGFIRDHIKWKEKPEEHTKTGVDEHELSARMITTNVPSGRIPDEVRGYVDYARDLPGHRFLVETRVPVPYRAGSICLLDYSTIDGDSMHVLDLKTGHKFVDVLRNLQLSIYGDAGRKLLSDIVRLKSVFLHIYSSRQPKKRRIQYVEYDMEELSEIVAPVYEAARTVRTVPWQDLPFDPSEDACRYCPARDAGCPARTSTSRKLCATPKGLLEPKLMSDEMIGLMLRERKTVENILKGVGKEALRRSQQPGFVERAKLKWVKSRDGNRAWQDGFDPGLVLGRKAYKDPVAMSPTQVEDNLGAEDYALVESEVHRPKGGRVLVPMTDKRKAIDEGGFGDIIDISDEPEPNTDFVFADIDTPEDKRNAIRAWISKTPKLTPKLTPNT